MSVIRTNNHLEVLIGKSLSRQTGAAASVDPNSVGVQVTDPSAAGYIQDGEIVVLDYLGRPLGIGQTVADSPRISIVQRSGSNLIFSPQIEGYGVTAYTGKAGVQGQEQIYSIGYDGVSSANAIDVSQGTDGILSITYNHDHFKFAERKKRRPYLIPVSTTATTAKLAARSMAEQINRGAYNDAECVKAEMLNSGTAAGSATATTVVVSNGSNVITLDAADTAWQTVGVTVRLGHSTTTPSGIGVTVPVYVITATPSTDSTLTSVQARINTPFQGPSDTLVEGTDAGIVTEGTSWGVKLTGMHLSEYDKDYVKFMRVQFSLTLTGMGTTPINKIQETKMGFGDGRIVAEIENFARGFEGGMHRLSTPVIQSQRDAVNTSSTSAVTGVVTASTLYDTIAIQYFSETQQGGVTPNSKQPMEMMIFVVDGSAQTKPILDQLNPWMASTAKSLPNIGGL